MAVTIATTTTSAAVTDSVTRIPLAAGTGVTRGWILVIDGEVMLVQATVPTQATTFIVLRGWDGTAAVPHKSGAAVSYGPRSYFGNMFSRTGVCDPTKEIALPSFNLTTMDVFDNSSGEWQQTKIGNTKATIT